MARSSIRNALNACLLVALCAPCELRAAEFEPSTPGAWQLPHGDLYGVDARDGLVVAVGYWGTILRSTDGGLTWSRPPTPTDATLYAAALGDSGSGWAVGAAGTILRTSDAGLTWAAVSVELPADDFQPARPLDIPLFDVAAVSAHEAWAVGDFGTILHTRDGSQWELVTVPPEAFADDNIPDRILNAVHFQDREQGWIVGEFGTTLRTSDGGQTWTGERSFSGAVEDVYLMDLASGGEARAVAGGTGGVVLQTADAGVSWTSTKLPTTAGLFGAAWTGRAALLVGDRGIMFFSQDDGVSWEVPVLPRLFNWFRAAAIEADGRAYVVGQNGIVLRSTDWGASWLHSAGAEPPPLDGVSSPAAPSSPPAVEPARDPAPDPAPRDEH